MSRARDVRRAALQVLYQFDAGRSLDDDLESVRDSLSGAPGTPEMHNEALELARAAWAAREAADRAVAEIAPAWPTHRQPVIDRSILRLAHYEMASGKTAPKLAINEAVELAKEYSTEKSPMFINGVLDKIYRTQRDAPQTDADSSAPGSEAVAQHEKTI